MNKKAVALLSGGLDSTLAIKLMLEQGVEVQQPGRGPDSRGDDLIQGAYGHRRGAEQAL